MSERERIEAVYRGYHAGDRYRKRWAPGPGQRLMLDGRWAATAALLARFPIDRARARVLDVGSSAGYEVPRFVDLGFRPESIVCLDLLRQSAAGGRRAHPTVSFVAADGAGLPFRDDQFDLVNQSVVASSAVDVAIRARIAEEMLRVATPGGLVLWYDVRYPSPLNPAIRPIPRRHLRRWFAGCRGEIASITLLPPLARLLAPYSVPLCRILERIPVLRSHYLAVFVKP